MLNTCSKRHIGGSWPVTVRLHLRELGVGAVQMRINGAMMAGGPSGAFSREEWGDPGHGPLVHHDSGGARMSWWVHDDVRQPDWEPYAFSRSTSRPMEPNSLLSKKEYDRLTSDSWMEVQESARSVTGVNGAPLWSSEDKGIQLWMVMAGRVNFSQPPGHALCTAVSAIAMNTNESVESSGEIIVLHYSCIEFLSGCPEVKMG